MVRRRLPGQLPLWIAVPYGVICGYTTREATERATSQTIKGDRKLIKVLNSLLADELTSINQYIIHAEMCENWGYGKLHEHFEKRAIVEMKHAERQIGRILFLEGIPVVDNLGKASLPGGRITSEFPTAYSDDNGPSNRLGVDYLTPTLGGLDHSDVAGHRRITRL